MKSSSFRRNANTATITTKWTAPAMVIAASLMMTTMSACALALPVVPALAAIGPSSFYSVDGSASCKALPLSGGNATWDSSWNQCNIPAGAVLALSGNGTLAVGSGIMLVNHGSIQNGGAVNVASGAMIHNNGTLDNTGKVGGGGSIQNAGVLNNAATVALSGSGGIENAKTGVMSNSGFINTGALTNAGIIFNSGLIDSKSHIQDTGIIANGGTIKSPP